MVDWQTEKALQISGNRAVYPVIAQVAHIEGSVQVQFVVATDGSTKELTYLSGPPLLMKAAMDAIRTWRFNPSVAAGAPAEVETIAAVNFFLPGHDASTYLAPFRKAVQKHPNDPNEHVALGQQMLNIGEPDDASEEFQKAISLQPSEARAYFGLGDAFAAKGDVESAIKEYRQGFPLNPSDADAYFKLSTLLDRQGDLQSAISEYRSGLQLKPRDGYRHDNFGILLMKAGDVDAAIGEFQQALRDDPENAFTHWRLGLALEQKGDLGGALREYKKASKEQPQNQDFKDAAERLATKLKTSPD
jgi:TonB family protein